MSLLSPPAPDFNDPLGLLAACHQRILGFCDLLERLGPWIDANGLDKEALDLSLIHISEPTRQPATSRMPSSA